MQQRFFLFGASLFVICSLLLVSAQALYADDIGDTGDIGDTQGGGGSSGQGGDVGVGDNDGDIVETRDGDIIYVPSTGQRYIVKQDEESPGGLGFFEYSGDSLKIGAKVEINKELHSVGAIEIFRGKSKRSIKAETFISSLDRKTQELWRATHLSDVDRENIEEAVTQYMKKGGDIQIDPSDPCYQLSMAQKRLDKLNAEVKSYQGTIDARNKELQEMNTALIGAHPDSSKTKKAEKKMVDLALDQYKTRLERDKTLEKVQGEIVFINDRARQCASVYGADSAAQEATVACPQPPPQRPNSISKGDYQDILRDATPLLTSCIFSDEDLQQQLLAIIGKNDVDGIAQELLAWGSACARQNPSCASKDLDVGNIVQDQMSQDSMTQCDLNNITVKLEPINFKSSSSEPTNVAAYFKDRWSLKQEWTSYKKSVQLVINTFVQPYKDLARALGW